MCQNHQSHTVIGGIGADGVAQLVYKARLVVLFIARAGAEGEYQLGSGTLKVRYT